jgi:hypothetical protein
LAPGGWRLRAAAGTDHSGQGRHSADRGQSLDFPHSIFLTRFLLFACPAGPGLTWISSVISSDKFTALDYE